MSDNTKGVTGLYNFAFILLTLKILRKTFVTLNKVTWFCMFCLCGFLLGSQVSSHLLGKLATGWCVCVCVDHL